jgi:hypothetical protein
MVPQYCAVRGDFAAVGDFPISPEGQSLAFSPSTGGGVAASVGSVVVGVVISAVATTGTCSDDDDPAEPKLKVIAT